MGRLNLIATYKDKVDYLYNSLNKGIIVDSKKKEYKYGIFKPQKEIIDNEIFLKGTLTKFLPLTELEKVDIETGEFNTEISDNQIVAKSNFFLHVKTGLIAFRPITNHISEEAFKSVVSEIIEKANDDLFINVDIQIISEEHDVFVALKEFSKINNIYITLHPSNPSFRDRWKEVDEELRHSNVETYSSKYTSSKGIKVSDESNVFSEISMASDGYGKADIDGEKNGVPFKASTNKLPVKFDVPKKEEHNNRLKGAILEKFKEIWDRMKK